MKKLCLLLLLCVPGCLWAQNVRYDAPFPSVSSTTSTPYLVANVPPNSPTLAVCHSPANAVPCTNYVTTYTSAAAACPNGAQDTPQPQPSACQSTGDAQGNIGFWAPAGTYDYTVCISGTVSCFGPYTVTLGGSGTAIDLQTNGVDNGSQSKLNLHQGTNVTLTDNGSGQVTIDATGGGGIGGSGTQHYYANWTGATSLGNSLLYDDGISEVFSAGQLYFLGIGGVNAGLATTSGPGGEMDLFGQDTSFAGATGGNINLDAGLGSTHDITHNGRISLGRTQQAFYFSTLSFAQLAVPKGNPASTLGATVYCTNCQGAFDGATQGSIAAGSGNGALLSYDPSTPAWRVVTGVAGGGSGTVTSVGLTVNSTSPSGIFTVTGSPVATSGSLNFNLAGTSGGIPCFTSSSVLSSSSALTANTVLLGGGAGVCPTLSAASDDGTTFSMGTRRLGVITGSLVNPSITFGGGFGPSVSTNLGRLVFDFTSGVPAIDLYISGAVQAEIGADSNGQGTLKSSIGSAASKTGWSLVNANPLTATSGTTITAQIAGSAGIFQPTSGNAKYVALEVAPQINQGGSASGDFTALDINVTESSVTGTNKWLQAWRVSGTPKAFMDDGGNLTVTSCTGCGSTAAFSGGLGTSFQDATEIAAPANPGAGNDRLYLNSTTHLLSCKTSGGADCMPSGGSVGFGSVTAGTNGAALLVGTGGSLGTSGAGTITATAVPWAGVTGTPTTLAGYGITDAVPNTRTVNGKALSSNITLSLASADFANQGTTTTVLHGNGAGNPSFGSVVGADMANNTVTATQLASQYSKWLVCTGKGLGDGLNAIPAGTYLQTTCMNTTGVTVTITGIKCFTDNNGTSTLNAAGNSLGALLTGAITCTNSYAAGTQSANVALTNGDYIKFTLVADGTTKQTDWVISGTY